MKKILLAFVAILGILACKSNNKKNEDTTMKDQVRTAVQLQTSLGTMTIELYNETPKHRDNFIKLVEDGYYDGILFHRVINGFMIQGGDPYTRDTSKRNQWGTGGPGYTVEAEFNSNLHHKKGAIAAARLGDMANPRRASSGSQFYIVQSEDGCRHLDGQYTVFGQVVDGLDVIDKIASVQTDPYDRPLQDVVIKKAFIVLVAPVAQNDSTAAGSSPAKDSTTTK